MKISAEYDGVSATTGRGIGAEPFVEEKENSAANSHEFFTSSSSPTEVPVGPATTPFLRPVPVGVSIAVAGDPPAATLLCRR